MQANTQLIVLALEFHHCRMRTLFWILPLWLVTGHASSDKGFRTTPPMGARQIVLQGNDRGFGLNEPFMPSPQHSLPAKKPFKIDKAKHPYQRFVNGSDNGLYRRSSCPAINILANRGYINRTGRNITYSELAHAVRRVWNFGDDNVRTS